MAKLVVGVNDLATKFPEIAAEWNYEKNGGLTPQSFTCGSGSKVWWTCQEGHSWPATIASRTRVKTGCPYCAGQKILVGFNDLATTRPDIAEQWHPTKNGNETPQMYTAGSNKKAWWVCECGYEWEATIASRTAGHGCTKCGRKRAIEAKRRPKPGKSFKDVYPELVKEWHPTKNVLGPECYAYKSNQDVWWICSKGHEWEAKVNNRAKGDNCPYCAGQKVLEGYNDLATVDPSLAEQWSDKNGDLKPTMVTASSNKEVWWTCEYGHDWEATVATRHRLKSGCPYCAGQRVIPGENDLATTNPELASEWNYERNGDLKPSDVMERGKRSVWWRCKYGHEWKAALYARANGNGCPDCAASRFASFPEKAITYYVMQHYDDVVENARPEVIGLGRMEFDIWIPSIRTVIEYDGQYWHQDIQRDVRKDKICQENGITLIRVREPKCPHYDTSAVMVHRQSLNNFGLTEAVVEVLALLGHDGSSVDVDHDADAIKAMLERTA